MISRCLAYVSQHPVFLGEGWLAEKRDNGVERQILLHTQGCLRERASGWTLSCALSMKSQPVRMSHIPGWTKEEVGLSPLSDTAGMRLRGKRNDWPCASDQPLSILISLSWFLRTRCVICCPLTPINTQKTEWGCRANVSLACKDFDCRFECFTLRCLWGSSPAWSGDRAKQTVCQKYSISTFSWPWFPCSYPNVYSLFFAAKGVGMLHWPDKCSDEWGDWTAPTRSSLRITQVYEKRGWGYVWA